MLPRPRYGSGEETHTFTPNILNQLKWGYARYNGPTFNTDEGTAYAASTMGLTGTPSGQASDAFPFVTYAGNDAPTNWAGEPASATVAENYTALDNFQWNKGRHSLNSYVQPGGLKLLYNVINDTSGSVSNYFGHSRHGDCLNHALQ